MLTHFTSARHINKKTIVEIFAKTDEIKSGKFNSSLLSNKIMATLFYEPSTRTRLSFESAMQRLGGNVISTENAAEFSSASKGETLEDTIRVVERFSDVIVLRHFLEGASEIAVKYSQVPIINAGDGKGEHPTQALLDLYTISAKFPLEGPKPLQVTLVGDLANGRTIHSLSYLIALYPKVILAFISPKALAIPSSLKQHLIENKIKFAESEDLNSFLTSSDVIYQTRIQKERFVNKKNDGFRENEYLHYFGKYIIDKNTLSKMKKDMILMHPLPRVNEITPDVDSDKRAVYFEQVQNGLYVRMALLTYIFDKLRPKTR